MPKTYRSCGKRETEMMTMPDADSTSDSEENEDELSKPRSQTSRGTNLLLKWEDGKKIYGPFPHNPTRTPASNSAWSMVLIKDNRQEDCSSLIFPPIHHENLHLSPQDHRHHDDGKSLTLPPSSSCSYSSSSAASLSEICEDDSNDDDTSTTWLPSSDSNPPAVGLESPVFTPTPKVRNVADVASRVNFGLELMYSKMRWVFGSVHFPVKVSALTTAAMLLGFLYFRWRRRRVTVAAEDGRNHLVRIIREKDERINQLLNQIARMNDVLLALQRVPTSNT